MAVSEQEAIIIGCIVGIAVIIVFGLVLWWFCSGRESTRSAKKQYDRVPIPNDGLTHNATDSDTDLVKNDKMQKTPSTNMERANETKPILDASSDINTTSKDAKDQVSNALTKESVSDAPKTSDIKQEQTDNIQNEKVSNPTVPDDDDNDVNDSEQKVDETPLKFGESQSPINILTSTQCGKTKIMPDEEFQSNPLRFDYPEQVINCMILNNGHTVQINIGKENKCTLAIHDKLYTLRQFHFHTPSEHLIDSQQFEMEMHLVHTNEENEIAVLGFIFTTKQKHFKPKLELSTSRRHLVLAPNKHKKVDKLKVMKEEEGSDDDLGTDDEWESDKDKDDDDDDKKKEEKANDGDSKEGNDFLSQFWDQLPVKKTTEDIPLSKPLSFDYLFETSSNNFVKSVNTNQIDIDMELFEYMGSLTTPPYTEGVQWLVSKRTHFINNSQLYKLSACWGHENNARAVQDYFGRTVSLRSKSSLKVIS